MAKVISESALRLAVEEGTFIKGGIPACAEGLKYDFRLGKRVLKASFGQPVNMEDLTPAERASMAVDPGEVAFARVAGHSPNGGRFRS